MKTRAMFRCQAVEKVEGWGDHPFLYNSKFNAVSGRDGEEAKKFFAASPSGSLTLQTVREDHFEVGKCYYLDFTPAEVE